MIAPTPRLTKSPRLKKRSEFLLAASKGVRFTTSGMVLQRRERGDDAPARLGFTVTKKIGNAVVRNRTKRRLREVARLVLAEQPVSGADLVLIGRNTTAGRDFAQLSEDFRRALRQTDAKPLCAE
jgi:ribonuclease P protein component